MTFDHLLDDASDPADAAEAARIMAEATVDDIDASQVERDAAQSILDTPFDDLVQRFSAQPSGEGKRGAHRTAGTADVQGNPGAGFVLSTPRPGALGETVDALDGPVQESGHAQGWGGWDVQKFKAGFSHSAHVVDEDFVATVREQVGKLVVPLAPGGRDSQQLVVGYVDDELHKLVFFDVNAAVSPAGGESNSADAADGSETR